MSVLEFSTDREYFGWLTANPGGYVLSVRTREGPLLHRANCTHIDRHNNPGALTERGTRKLCSTSRQELRSFARDNGLISGIALEKCQSCDV
jgi:hypothetical protein